eukprot:Platyproteum_vivax@DN5980_c0_g1_i2.p2
MEPTASTIDPSPAHKKKENAENWHNLSHDSQVTQMEEYNSSHMLEHIQQLTAENQLLRSKVQELQLDLKTCVPNAAATTLQLEGKNRLVEKLQRENNRLSEGIALMMGNLFDTPPPNPSSTTTEKLNVLPAHKTLCPARTPSPNGCAFSPTFEHSPSTSEGVSHVQNILYDIEQDLNAICELHEGPEEQSDSKKNILENLANIEFAAQSWEDQYRSLTHAYQQQEIKIRQSTERSGEVAAVMSDLFGADLHWLMLQRQAMQSSIEGYAEQQSVLWTHLQLAARREQRLLTILKKTDPSIAREIAPETGLNLDLLQADDIGSSAGSIAEKYEKLLKMQEATLLRATCEIQQKKSNIDGAIPTGSKELNNLLRLPVFG